MILKSPNQLNAFKNGNFSSNKVAIRPASAQIAKLNTPITVVKIKSQYIDPAHYIKKPYQHKKLIDVNPQMHAQLTGTPEKSSGSVFKNRKKSEFKNLDLVANGDSENANQIFQVPDNEARSQL